MSCARAHHLAALVWVGRGLRAPGLYLAMLLGVLGAPVTAGYDFSVSMLNGLSLGPATSLQFGPDQRLYVSQVDGRIRIFRIQRLAKDNYTVTATETVDLIKQMPNYNDDGTLVTPAMNKRQTTGILVVGTAAHPVIYVAHSDPRIGGGAGGENDLNLDTNSSMISRLTWTGTKWDNVAIIRGLPRSEENHAVNGLQIDSTTNTLYATMGGNTNAGSPSVGFAFHTETALTTAILAIDLNAINAMPVKTDATGEKYLYDLPTLDDPNPERPRNPDGSNFNDPFGGNDGLNQAKYDPNGPVKIYATGFRNIYDIVITKTAGRAGRMYGWDNGANKGWGGWPKNHGTDGRVTNEYDPAEPGSTGAGSVNNLDNLHLITPGFYGGHPNPIRANPAGAGHFHYDNVAAAAGLDPLKFSLQPTSDWPPYPVELANPIEGHYRQPGAEDGALLTLPTSTNGIAEYVGTNFGGEMQGNLISVSFNGIVIRTALNSAGTAVTNGLEVLASGFGSQPLDVTCPSPGYGTAFIGTIWVAHYMSSGRISIFEPADFDSPGTNTCTGVDSWEVDEDGDGYSNADEILNGTNPCSSASRPADFDGDGLSDLVDDDDDNDGIKDVDDVFPIDPRNGLDLSPPMQYHLFNETSIGFFGIGFTGVMLSTGDDYLTLFDEQNLVAGGTAGLFTIGEVGSGTALGAANSQRDAFHFGLNVNRHTGPFLVRASMGGPFFNLQPTGQQSQGIYLGNGDQDNYVRIALHANNGAGGAAVTLEQGGVVVSNQVYPLPTALAGTNVVHVYLAVDPRTGQVQPQIQMGGAGAITNVGPALQLGGPLLAALQKQQAIALGVSASTGGAPVFAATWDDIEVTTAASSAQARIVVESPSGSILTSSSYTANTFQIYNQSTGGQSITGVTFDISQAVFRDLVFDPYGTAGDPDFKPFEPNNTSGVGTVVGTFRQPLNGSTGEDGYQGLDITFTSFAPGGFFNFSVDVDPSSIKAAPPPGPNHSGSVSGLELIGSAVTVHFSDGTTQSTRLSRLGSSVKGSEGVLSLPKPPEATLEVPGQPAPFTTGNHVNIRITGPSGHTAQLVHIEAGLFVEGVPGGGYNIDPYEANTALSVAQSQVAIPAAGYVDVPVALKRTDAAAGLNHFVATLVDPNGVRGPASAPLVIHYDPTLSTDTQAPTPPANLTASQVTTTAVNLTWAAATDNVGVTGYLVFRQGTLIGSTTTLSYIDGSLLPDTSYTYDVVAEDAAGNGSTPATLTVKTAAVNTDNAIRINTGGGTFVDTLGRHWEADRGFNTGGTYTTSAAIAGTADDALYQSERWDGAASPELLYTIPVSNGSYEVRLHFAEIASAQFAVGKRVFDVLVEGTRRIADLDIFQEAGGNTALVKTIPVTISDGQLNIELIRKLQNPKISAIEIIATAGSDTEAPTAPAGLTASAVTASSVTLTWTASTDNVGVAGYDIWRDNLLVQQVTGTTFTDTNRTAATTYSYQVVAQDAAGNSAASAVLPVTTAGPPTDGEAPTAPGALTATEVSASSVTLTWNASTDNVGVVGYDVQRDGILVQTVAGTTFTDTGRTAATHYTYQVIAKDAAGNTATSVLLPVTTLSPGGSTGTSILRVNAGGGNYTESSGQVWAADSGFNTGLVASTSTTVSGTTVSPLYRTERYDPSSAPELLYSFTVPNGNYELKLHFSETHAASQAVGKRVFDVKVENQVALAKFDIFAEVGPNAALVKTIPVTIADGQLNIEFIRSVQNPKVNAIELVQATHADDQAPTAPGSLAATSITANSVALSWTAATDNVGVVGYDVLRDGALVQTVTSTTFTDTERAAATTYTYQVVAKDAAGNTTASTSIQATTATTTPTDTQPPTAPGSLTVSGVTATSVMISWTAATDNVGVVGYDVLRDGALVQTVSSTTFTDTERAAATTYTYQVVAKDAAGNSTPSVSIQATTSATTPTDTQPPTAPGALTVSGVTATSVTLSWTAATDNVGVVGYDVLRDGALVQTVTSTTFTDTGRTAAAAYTYQVVAKDAAGNATASVSVPVTTSSAGGSTGNAILRVNAGGTNVTDSTGQVWAADNSFNTGFTASTSIAVTGTTLAPLYRTERYDPVTAPELMYSFPVANGSYELKLHFAETHTASQGVGKRVFDVKVENEVVLSKFDIFAEAGANVALVKTVPVTITDGQLNIEFIRAVQNPKINAIELVTLGDTLPPSAPAAVTASEVTTASLTLTWGASTDNVGVVGYDVLRDGVWVQSIAGTTYTDAGRTAGTTYTYTVVAKDAAGNTTASAPLSVTTLSAGTAVLRVNAGGGSYSDSGGQVWMADNGFNTGLTAANSNPITGTTMAPLYRSERYDISAAPELMYNFAVPNGNYQLKLHFAETHTASQAVGKRVFDVKVENQVVLTKLDIFAEAGANAALVKTVPVSITDGQLNIEFNRSVQNPKINAIELVTGP